MFKKYSVKITRAEEFTFAPFFKNARSGTNGWKIADYKDPMRSGIALDVMHILRPQRTTYVTAWQGAISNGSTQTSVGGPSANKRAVRKATSEEAEGTRARPKKKTSRGVVVIESSDNSVEKTVVAAVATAEDKTNKPTLQVLEGETSLILVEVQTDVVVEPSEERTETASPSFLSSEQTRSVGSEDIPQPKISEELAKELTLNEAILEQIVAEVGGTVEDIADIPEPPPPEEEVRSEVATKILKEGPKALKIDFPDFLHDSVVSLLKYLDKKREKYTVRSKSGSYVELIRNRTKLRSAVAVKRECASATAMAKERATSLTAECAIAKAILEEQED
ncbi:hypothetical protein AXG93_2891s1600 [Marchantia polymorpha subsp. ruderalis]|uniref:Uncharacterized protein n=1 Tax=Marchantia polymorpha subsp. ruderalis TaxID=1480154 RepID=A0A176WMN9_MARPO|nr:hypothetical protein AXG93_2891s1600 [Marchantia polymorpha subsp. ruderalis]